MSVEQVCGVIGCVVAVAVFLFLGFTVLLSYLWHDDPARDARK